MAEEQLNPALDPQEPSQVDGQASNPPAETEKMVTVAEMMRRLNKANKEHEEKTQEAIAKALEKYKAESELTGKELEAYRQKEAEAYKLYAGAIPDMDAISINLDDVVFTDRNAELDYWLKMVMAGFAPKSMAIQKVLNLDESMAKQTLAEINSETLDVANQGRSEQDVAAYGD